jgi:general secretion pathway protein M
VNEPQRRRTACILAWSVVVVIPLALLLGVGMPWWARVSELDERIAAQLDQVARYQGLLASLPRLRAELEQERSNEDFKAFYYEAQTPALAGAQLQRELQDMVRGAGARLINAQFLPAGAEEQPPRVRIRTQLQGKTEALLDLLFAIEQARPFLFVDQLSVRSMTRRSIRPTRRVRGRRSPVVSQAEGQLTIRLDVYGYALGGRQ